MTGSVAQKRYDQSPKGRTAKAAERARNGTTRSAKHRQTGKPAVRHKAFRLERRLLIDGQKNVPCADCGNRFPPECRDFDHVRGEKIRNVGLMACAALDRLLAEIHKCEVVCANCHRIRTVRRFNLGHSLV